jgi:uncharacterized Zn-finger protein
MEKGEKVSGHNSKRGGVVGVLTNRHVECPHCGTEFNVYLNYKEGKLVCPGCSKGFVPEYFNLDFKQLEEGAEKK